MRIVVKVGTQLLTEGGECLCRPRLRDLARQLAFLRKQSHEMVLVSSGAVFAGREILGPPTRRRDIPFKQVLAAAGQVRLMSSYSDLFAQEGIHVAQALLTRADLADRERYLNARSTLLSLLRLGVIPIVNENDVVAIEEIKIGDNDNLSALVANLLDADLLIILTDLAGLFTADPNLQPDAELIREVDQIDERIRGLAGGSRSSSGTGGMVTKLEAADFATRSGTDVIIAAGREQDVLLRLCAGESIGTRFRASTSRIEARKRWILAETPKGSIYIDEGAAQALIRNGKSLLAAGVCDLAGDFVRGRTVRLMTREGREIGRGITNYDAADLRAIRGRHSKEIAKTLGYQYGPTIVHRDDLVLI